MPADQTLAGTWNIDPSHTRLGFATRHAMVTKVRGAFNEVSGSVVIDPEDWGNSTVNVVMQAASIDTRNADRDAHLRSADFFDVEQFPEITFTGTGIDQVEENSFLVPGDLTMHGITRSITVPLGLLGIETDQTGALRAGFEGSRRINRREWGLQWNTTLDSGGVLVSDKINLEFELSLVKE